MTTKLPTRTIGQGLEVSALALGAMGYGDPIDREEMITLLRAAVERGVTSSTPPSPTALSATRSSSAKRSSPFAIGW